MLGIRLRHGAGNVGQRLSPCFAATPVFGRSARRRSVAQRFGWAYAVCNLSIYRLKHSALCCCCGRAGDGEDEYTGG